MRKNNTTITQEFQSDSRSDYFQFMSHLDEAMRLIRDCAWRQSVHLDWTTLRMDKTKVVSDFSFSGEEYTAVEFAICLSGVRK